MAAAVGLAATALNSAVADQAARGVPVAPVDYRIPKVVRVARAAAAAQAASVQVAVRAVPVVRAGRPDIHRLAMTAQAARLVLVLVWAPVGMAPVVVADQAMVVRSSFVATVALAETSRLLVMPCSVVTTPWPVRVTTVVRRVRPRVQIFS